MPVILVPSRGVRRGWGALEPVHGSRAPTEGFDERELAEHGRRFLEISSDLLAIVDMEGSIVWANGSWARVLGVGLDEIRGHGYRRFLHPEDVERLDREIEIGRAHV
jgi:PAS domain-containing protein